MIPSSRNECRKFKQGRRRRAREGIVLIMTLCEHRADDYDASWSSDLPTPSPRPFLMPFFAGRRKSEGGSETLRPLSRTPNEEPRVSPRNELSRGRIAREFSRGAVGGGGGSTGVPVIRRTSSIVAMSSSAMDAKGMKQRKTVSAFFDISCACVPARARARK